MPVSDSREVFIPVTHLCRDACHYCTFVTVPVNLRSQRLDIDMEPNDILEVAHRGARSDGVPPEGSNPAGGTHILTGEPAFLSIRLVAETSKTASVSRGCHSCAQTLSSSTQGVVLRVRVDLRRGPASA